MSFQNKSICFLIFFLKRLIDYVCVHGSVFILITAILFASINFRKICQRFKTTTQVFVNIFFYFEVEHQKEELASPEKVNIKYPLLAMVHNS